MAELTPSETLRLLQEGTLEMEGLISWGSNYTFLARACSGDHEIQVIYKPRKGERPLWDFAPGTLCLRERAAYLVSEVLGWHLVPPTVLRDGPHGWGSVQQYIEHDVDEHYFTFQGEYQDQLRRIVLFDFLINNADRKGGHVLVDENGRLWSIDHGICFHSDYKLRSVIWDFAGTSIPSSMREELRHFQICLQDSDDPVVVELAEILSDREMESLQRRLKKLLKDNTFPQPGPGRHYPWPPV